MPDIHITIFTRAARRILSLVLLFAICAAMLPSNGRHRVQAAPLAQGETYTDTWGDPNELYLTYTISGITNLDRTGDSRTWTAEWAGGAIHFSGMAIAVVQSGFVSNVKLVAELTGIVDTSNSVSWAEGGGAGELSGGTAELPFDFTYTPQPGDWKVSAYAVAQMCGGVCKAYTVWISLYIDAIEETTEVTVEVEETVGISPTPQREFVVGGRVYAPADLASWTTTDIPMPEVLVELVRDGNMVGRTISQLPNGNYELAVPEPGDYALQVTLEHAATTPGGFRIMHDQDSDAVKIQTATFTVDANSPSTITKDIVFAADQGHSVIQGTAPVDRLPSLSLIYAYTQKAWQEAIPRLGVTLDLGLPYEVYAFDTGQQAVASGAYADAPLYKTSSTTDAAIHLSPDDSTTGKKLRAFTIWHEFGHCVQADIEGNSSPTDGTQNWHDGYINALTMSSWVEGFASFYALLVDRDIEGASSPRIPMSGWTMNFEFSYYMPWSFAGSTSLEEYAVVSLLWDLVDSVENVTEFEISAERMANQGISMAQAPDASKPVMLYGDFVQMTAGDLLKALAEPTTVDPAIDSNPHIADIRQLYSVLKSKGIGSEASVHPGLDKLDELFIAHGFFADIAPGDLYYDAGEQIGYTANLAMTINPGTPEEVKIPDRINPLRRYPPPIPDSFLAYDVVDKRGNALSTDIFSVSVWLEEPYNDYSYSFSTRAEEYGKLVVMMPDPMFPATVEIKAVNSDGVSEPLTLTSGDYWAALRNVSGGVFMQHTFEIKAQSASPIGGFFEELELEDNMKALIGAVCGCALLAGILLGAVIALRRRKHTRRPASKRRAPARTRSSQSYPQSAPPPPVPPADYRPVEVGPTRMPEQAEGGVMCPDCGGRNLPNARFCATCGISLAPAPVQAPATPEPQEIVCPTCMHHNRPGARFCARCGRQL